MSKSNGFGGHTIPSYPVTKSKHHNPSELPSVHLWNRDPDSLLLCRGPIQFAWTLPVSKQKVPPPGNCLSWANSGWLVVLEMDTSPPKNEPPDTPLGPQDSQTAQQCSVRQEAKEGRFPRWCLLWRFLHLGPSVVQRAQTGFACPRGRMHWACLQRDLKPILSPLFLLLENGRNHPTWC